MRISESTVHVCKGRTANATILELTESRELPMETEKEKQQRTNLSLKKFRLETRLAQWAQPYCNMTVSKERVHTEDGKRVANKRAIDDTHKQTNVTNLVCIKTLRMS